MRIAYIVPSKAPLGPVIVVRNLVEQMVSHSHECVVFYFDEKPDEMTFACETRKISFWQRVDFSGFDWVHAHAFRPMLYAVRLRNARKITTLHSYLFTEYRFSLGRVFGKLLGNLTMRAVLKFDKVAVLSEDAKYYYSRWIPLEKLRVCYNGIQIDTLPSADVQTRFVEDVERIRRFKGDTTLVACISELVPIKNVDSMIRAMALLPTTFRLLLIGSGESEKTLKQLAEQLRITERVLFLGERTEAHRYLPMIDIFAMTSLSEGFCLSLVEAAMYGKKIVCANIDGMREKFPADAVTFFVPSDSQSLAKAIVEAEKMPEKGLRAKEIAEQRFTAAHMYEAYQKIYHEQEPTSLS